MKKIISLVLAIGVTFMATESAFAANSKRCGTRPPYATQRQKNQQHRINRGARSGELTKREFLRLEREQYQIQQEKREARSDGDVTKRERVGLQKELNQASRHIYRAKHNERDRN